MAPLLQTSAVTKTFPGVTALDKVDFTVEAGEVHALLGENGAGKSTLTKVISGDYPPDAGSILIDGSVVAFISPRDARAAGIRLVSQELTLVPTLSVAENVLLGHLPQTKVGLIDWNRANGMAAETLKRLGVKIELSLEVSQLRPAEQQLIEIAKALTDSARILILDEPTAALSATEADRLFDVIRALRSHGVGVIYISHRVYELRQIADRVTVLRDGRVVGTHHLSMTSRDELVKEMVGRELGEMYPSRKAEAGEVLLQLKDMTVPGVCEEVTLNVRAGEIVAVFGLLGSGATELPYLAAKRNTLVTGRSRVGLIPADRKQEAIFPTCTVQRNISAPMLRRFRKRGLFDYGAEQQAADRQISALGIRPARANAPISSLSGGNQQKVVLGRWLEYGADLLLLSEPTRGVDVGARADVYSILSSICSSGGGVLIASSDIDEVVGLADRVYVMRRGRIVAEFVRPAFTAEKIMGAATS
ncbi:MAG: sugar ABC transporter ATP-binding protein [Candidatus Dormibacteraceae bacterium]